MATKRKTRRRVSRKRKSKRLTAAARRKLRKSQFGLPGSRKYPMPDRSHAINAKARATQQWKKGRISKSTRDRIIAKANRILRRKKKKKK